MITDARWCFPAYYAISDDEAKVVQYRYRTARVANCLIEFERDNKMEKLLAEKAGKQTDNHTVYEVIFKNGNSVVIMCSDLKMYIGVGVIEEHW